MATLEIEVDDDAVTVEGPTDDRGRLTLGSEYAEQTVEVVVVATADTEANTAD